MATGFVFAMSLASLWALWTGLKGRFDGLYVLLGLAGIALSGAYIVHEWPHWDKKWTREKLVSSSFVFGFSLICWGVVVGHINVEFMGWIYLVVTGLCVLFGSLIVGLVCAFLPEWLPAKKYRYVKVQDRYGLDEKFDLVIDHPCPWEDHMTPMVRFGTLDGHSLLVRATPTAYEFALPGTVVDIRVKKRRVVEVTLRQTVKRNPTLKKR